MARVVDTVCLLTIPGAGDDIQAIKAGVNVTVTSTVLAEAALLAYVAPPSPVNPNPLRSVA